MPFFAQQSREQLRQMYVDAWRKQRAGQVMEPLEAQIAAVVALHPEYQTMLEQPDAPLDRSWTPEGGESNPFLHMGLHLAIRDQIATDRPTGIRQVFHALCERSASPHEAEHLLLDCLAEALWSAQRAGTPPDEQAYLQRVKTLLR